MPELNGWEFLGELQSESGTKELVVAMVTSSINRADRIKASGYSQVVAFYEKPFSVAYTKDLLEKVNLDTSVPEASNVDRCK